MPQLDASLLLNETAQRDIKELEQINYAEQQQYQVFQQALQLLKSTVDEVERKICFTGTISGKISIIIPLQENRFLQAGKIIGYIITDEIHF